MTDFLNDFKNRMITNSESKQTVRQYVAYMKKFFTYSNINSPSEITDALILNYCANVFPKQKQASKNAFRASLAKVIKYYDLNNFKSIPEYKMAVTENTRLPIEPEEFKALIKGIGRNEFQNPYSVKALIAFFYYTGLREGEVEKLNRKDIEGQEYIMVFQDKNKRTRPIYINEKLRDLLQQYFRYEPPKTEKLFNMKASTMRYLVDKAFKIVLGKKGFPHLLRHSFVTNCHREGVDIKIIQMAVGHKTLRQTEEYLKVNPMMVVKELKEKVKPIEMCNIV